MVVRELTLPLYDLTQAEVVVRLVEHHLGELELHEHGLAGSLLISLIDLEAFSFAQLVWRKHLAVTVEHEGATLRALAVAQHVNLGSLRQLTDLKDVARRNLTEDDREGLLHLRIHAGAEQSLKLALSLEKLGQH